MYVVDCSEPKTEQLIEGVGRAFERVGALSLSPVTPIPVPCLISSLPWCHDLGE